MKIVVCDDDAVLVSVMRTNVLSEHDVVGVTSQAYEAAELVESLGADAIILDLSLGIGSGKDAIDALQDRHVPCDIIVFTAFAGEREALLSAGASAVVEKPDFEALREAVAEVGRRVDSRPAKKSKGRDAAAHRRERRRPAGDRPPMPPLLVASPSGLEPANLFKEAVDAAQPGDAVLVVALDGLEGLVRSWGELVAIDHRLAVARGLRAALREDDRMTIEDDGTIVVLLVAGEPQAAETVFARVADAWRAAGGEGTIRAGYSICVESESPAVALGRAHGALVDSRASRTERLIRG